MSDRIGPDSPIGSFTWPVERHHLSLDATIIEISADADARRSVAERLGLKSLDNLSARFEVRLDGDPDSPDTGALVEGDVVASGEQRCVVTLEPVGFTIETTVAGVILPPDSSELSRDELTLEDDAVEILGIIEGGVIDLGEIAVQQLALELDPFPRKPGVEADWHDPDDEDTESGGNTPFAALAKLKDSLT